MIFEKKLEVWHIVCLKVILYGISADRSHDLVGLPRSVGCEFRL